MGRGCLLGPPTYLLIRESAADHYNIATLWYGSHLPLGGGDLSMFCPAVVCCWGSCAGQLCTHVSTETLWARPKSAALSSMPGINHVSANVNFNNAKSCMRVKFLERLHDTTTNLTIAFIIATLYCLFCGFFGYFIESLLQLNYAWNVRTFFTKVATAEHSLLPAALLYRQQQWVREIWRNVKTKKVLW